MVSRYRKASDSVTFFSSIEAEIGHADGFSASSIKMRWLGCSTVDGSEGISFLKLRLASASGSSI